MNDLIKIEKEYLKCIENNLLIADTLLEYETENFSYQYLSNKLFSKKIIKKSNIDDLEDQISELKSCLKENNEKLAITKKQRNANLFSEYLLAIGNFKQLISYENYLCGESLRDFINEINHDLDQINTVQIIGTPGDYRYGSNQTYLNEETILINMDKIRVLFIKFKSLLSEFVLKGDNSTCFDIEFLKEILNFNIKYRNTPQFLDELKKLREIIWKTDYIVKEKLRSLLETINE